MAYDWYPCGWWKQTKAVDCDTEKLQRFLERAISLRLDPDNNSGETDVGIVSIKADLNL